MDLHTCTSLGQEKYVDVFLLRTEKNRVGRVISKFELFNVIENMMDQGRVR